MDQGCRGLFRNKISFPNTTTISEDLSRQKLSNQIYNKALPGQIQWDWKCSNASLYFTAETEKCIRFYTCPFAAGSFRYALAQYFETKNICIMEINGYRFLRKGRLWKIAAVLISTINWDWRLKTVLNSAGEKKVYSLTTLKKKWTYSLYLQWKACSRICLSILSALWYHLQRMRQSCKPMLSSSQ